MCFGRDILYYVRKDRKADWNTDGGGGGGTSGVKVCVEDGVLGGVRGGCVAWQKQGILLWFPLKEVIRFVITDVIVMSVCSEYQVKGIAS